MTIDEKEQILRRLIDQTNFLDERDKLSVIAYIRGTADTRERVSMENYNNLNSVYKLNVQHETNT